MFVWNYAIDFYNKYFQIILIILLSYIPLMVFIQNLMENRKKFILKKTIFLWNMTLSIFSMCCVYNITIPTITTNKTFSETICTDVLSNENSDLAFWRFLFVLSKFPEMIDSLWIVLKKRKLNVLQVWHHFSVTLYCWIITYSPGGQGTYFAGMNGFVHSIMYSYYALVSISKFRSNKLAKTITVLQIIQMIVGIVILIYKTLFCINVYIIEMVFAYIMYSSYLYLFLQYFFERYKMKPKVE